MAILEGTGGANKCRVLGGLPRGLLDGVCFGECVKYRFTAKDPKGIIEEIKRLGFSFLGTYKTEQIFYDDELFSNAKQNVWIKAKVRDCVVKFSKRSIIGDISTKTQISLHDFRPDLVPRYFFTVYRSIYKKGHTLLKYDLVECGDDRFLVFCISGYTNDNMIIMTDDLFSFTSRGKVLEIMWRKDYDIYNALSHSFINGFDYYSFDFVVDISFKKTNKETYKFHNDVNTTNM